MISQPGCAACTLTSAGTIIFTRSIKEAKQRGRNGRYVFGSNWFHSFVWISRFHSFTFFPSLPMVACIHWDRCSDQINRVFFVSFFFFVYGNYCLRIVSNVTRLSMRQAGGRGEVMRGNSDQPSEYILLQLKGTSAMDMDVVQNVGVCTFLLCFLRWQGGSTSQCISPLNSIV